MNWKELSKKVSNFHDEYKASIVSSISEPLKKGNLLNLTEKENLFTQEGPKVSPKKLRKWLWENRNSRSLTRDGFVLWSSYDDDENVSYVGIGTLVNQDKGSRFPPTHLIPVETGGEA